MLSFFAKIFGQKEKVKWFQWKPYKFGKFPRIFLRKWKCLGDFREEFVEYYHIWRMKFSIFATTKKPIFISTSLDLCVMHDFKDDCSLDTDASGVDSSSQLSRPCWPASFGTSCRASIAAQSMPSLPLSSSWAGKDADQGKSLAFALCAPWTNMWGREKWGHA